MLSETLNKPKPIIGTVHLQPLPGAPGWSGRTETIITAAEQAAMALASGGVDGLLIENTGDMPSVHPTLPPAALALMTALAKRLDAMTGLPLGISVLPNDVEAALAIALAVDAQWIRVPVLLGSLLTPWGWLAPALPRLLAMRQALRLGGRRPSVWADIGPGHQWPGEPQQETAMASVPHALCRMAQALEATRLVDGLLYTGNDLEMLQTLSTASALPVSMAGSLPLAELSDWAPHAEGYVWPQPAQDAGAPGATPRPVDMLDVERWVTAWSAQPRVLGSR
jgi:hypothetical protein